MDDNREQHRVVHYSNRLGARMSEEHVIGGLLFKRAELMKEIGALREQMAAASNAIDALDHVLETYGHTADLEGRTPRAARIVLFYRNELRNFLIRELSNSPDPLTSRELACRVCETEGKSIADRRLINDITKRVGVTLRKMRATKVVEGQRGPDGSAVWRVVKRGGPTFSALSAGQVGTERREIGPVRSTPRMRSSLP